MSTAADAVLPPGTVVGRYRIEQAVAVGGPDGPVYRGRDAATSRRVTVLEFLPPGIARRLDGSTAVEPIDGDLKPLFAAGLAEVQALALDFSTFRHSNVLAILDCFAANDTVYLVLEHPDGRPLDRLLGASEALAPEEVQEILPAILAGVEGVHRAGLLHLDICPAAIAIRRDGSATLGRVHLVRRTLGAPDRGAVPSARDCYRAEEYFQPNGRLGPWTDIYALAATLFRLATGKPPPDPLARRRALAGGKAGPAAADPVGRALDAVAGQQAFVTAIRHGLSIPPQNRPQSVAALRSALGAAGPAEIPTLPLRELGAKPDTARPDAARPNADRDDDRTKLVFPERRPGQTPSAHAPTAPVPRRARTESAGPEGNPLPAAESEAPTVRMGRTDPDATKPMFPPRPPQRSEPPASQDDVATVRMGRAPAAVPPRAGPPRADRTPSEPRTLSTPPPILAQPAAPAASIAGEKMTTVIYRRGRAQVITAPPKSAAAPAPGGASDAEAAILPARFSVFHPMLATPGQWLDLAVYLHEPGIDSFVRQDHMSRYEGGPGETPERRGATRYSLKPGAAVTVVPYLPGCRINPPRATVEWWENFHRLSFRVMANPGAPGYAEGAAMGAILLFVGPLLVGEMRLAFTVGREKAHPISNTAALAADTFDAVFPAYAPQDSEVADRFAGVGAQFDNPFLAEILAMREGEWDREILKRIEAAERFQLFWSAAASRSPHVEEEWKFALALGRERFLRAFYWRHPAPGLPAALADPEAGAELRYLVLTLE